MSVKSFVEAVRSGDEIQAALSLKNVNLSRSYAVLEGATILQHLLLRSNNPSTEMIRHLIRTVIPVDLEDEYGRTALNYASVGARQDIVRVLLSEGADIHTRDLAGCTPLHVACKVERMNVYAWDKQRLDTVQLLLDNSADIHAKDKHGWTPLYGACAKGNIGVAQLLLEQGADVDAGNNEGWTALHQVCSRNNPNICQLLLDHGASIDMLDSTGDTPLHRSCVRDNHHVVRVLLDNGANITIRNYIGITSLQLAKQMQCVGIVELLENHLS